ncbi:unnamed protein product [Bemisia tabaci]|uniref:Uncharacterized protein n=1 Tax=Bemisia tabaci TaxID=7038 RepID=A0AAI8Y5R8_BEMTA|nr:unnamed protein product [Bemisia tabaci]
MREISQLGLKEPQRGRLPRRIKQLFRNAGVAQYHTKLKELQRIYNDRHPLRQTWVVKENYCSLQALSELLRGDKRGRAGEMNDPRAALKRLQIIVDPIREGAEEDAFSLSSYVNAAPTKQNDENPESLSPVQLQSPEVYPTAVVLQPTSLDKETGHQINSLNDPTPEIHLQERFLCLPSFKRRNNNAGSYKGKKLRPSASNSNSRRKHRGRRPNSSPPPGSPKSPTPTVVTTPGPVSGPRGPPSPPSPGHPSTWKNHGDHAMYYQPPNYPHVHVIPYKEGPLQSFTDSMYRATWAS